MNLESASPLRRSALVLHSMAAGDRDWVLERLPEAERAGLAPLLAELARLGMSADRTLLTQLAAQPGPARPSAAPGLAGAPAPLAELSAADPALLALVLRNEPARLTALFLQAHAWPWHEQLLQRLEPATRKQVVDRLHGSEQAAGEARTGACGAAMQRLLLAAVARRVQVLQAARGGAPAAPQRRAAAVERSWYGRLFGARNGQGMR